MKRTELQALFDCWRNQDSARQDTHLTTYSPGDGRTRYAIVKGVPDYFGGDRLLWANNQREIVSALQFAIRCDYLTKR
jgi:hypothetical protein